MGIYKDLLNATFAPPSKVLCSVDYDNQPLTRYIPVLNLCVGDRLHRAEKNTYGKIVDRFYTVLHISEHVILCFDEKLGVKTSFQIIEYFEGALKKVA